MAAGDVKVLLDRFAADRKRRLFICRRLLFVTEISFLGLYEVDWQIEYTELKEEPVVKPNLNQIQILTTVRSSPLSTPCLTFTLTVVAKEGRQTDVHSFVRKNGQISKHIRSSSMIPLSTARFTTSSPFSTSWTKSPTPCMPWDSSLFLSHLIQHLFQSLCIRCHLLVSHLGTTDLSTRACFGFYPA